MQAARLLDLDGLPGHVRRLSRRRVRVRRRVVREHGPGALAAYALAANERGAALLRGSRSGGDAHADVAGHRAGRDRSRRELRRPGFRRRLLAARRVPGALTFRTDLREGDWSRDTGTPGRKRET